MISNAQRGEATMYPKLKEELYEWNNIQSVGVGSNIICVSSKGAINKDCSNQHTKAMQERIHYKCVGWGAPVAGMCIYVYVYVWMCVYSVCRYMYVCECVGMCVYVWGCVCVCVYIYI